MSIFSKYKFVILIFLFAVIFRFWQLGQIPLSLNWDEVAFGYNAYAIGIDGKDEFGKYLPYAYLESYGDFKPPLYAYASVIPIKFFGLNEFSVRFASAFFGSLTVLLCYFLTREIFYKANHKEQYALFAMLFLAISPWHINLSRAGFEANVASFFIVLGVFTFLFAIRSKSMLLVVSAVSFALSLYVFNTSRVVVPLFVLALAVGFYKQLWKVKKQVIIACIVGTILVIPLIPFLLSPQASLRFKEVNIFSNEEIIKTANQQIGNNNNAWWSRLLHNRRVLFANEYVKHYFDNLNPNFLFISGDENHRFGTKDVGLLYIWEIPFFILGVIFLFRRREDYWWILPIWILIGIIPAATARETPHALRIETIIPTLQIVSAIGVTIALRYIRQQKISQALRKTIVVGVFFLLFVNVLYYIHGYYRHYPNESAGEWQYGYKDAISYAQSVEGDYDAVSMTEELGRPYAYVLFYTQANPQDFRSKAKVTRDAFGFVTVQQYGKYHFSKNPNQYQKEEEKILYVNIPESVPKNATIIKEFRYPDGFKRLTAYTYD